MTNLAKKLLLATVFYTGAVVLIVEVLAVRILAPYFGSTMYSVSSVLSVVLAALSVGYYFGGKWSDSHPSKKLFFGIIFVSGISLIAMQLLTLYVVPDWSESLSMITGPLWVSIILFFIPSFLLGTLSPLVIKLFSVGETMDTIGSLAGKVFFWSTLGSIVGSLLSGFVLIPSFGLNNIVRGLAISLLLIGAIGLFIDNKKKLIGSLILVIVLSGASLLMVEKVEALISYEGIYQRISVIDSDYKGTPARLLMLDKNPSSAVDKTDNSVIFTYTKYYKLYKYFAPEMKSALVLGGGAFIVPEALVNSSPEVTVEAVEIEPSLFNLGKEYFGVKDSDRLIVSNDDGRVYLKQTKKKYDLIFGDVFHSLYGVPVQFTTKEFYVLSKSKLNNNGVIMVNAIGQLSNRAPSFLMSEIKTFRSVYPNSYFLAVYSPSSSKLQNVMMIGVNGDQAFDWNSIKEKELIDLTKNKLVDLSAYDWGNYELLTDDFAPVDYYNAITLQEVEKARHNYISGEEALASVAKQVSFGQRYLGSDGHQAEVEYITKQLNKFTLNVQRQAWEETSPAGVKYEFRNVLARFWPENKQRIIFVTHYDTKKIDSVNFVGANDGASGVAVMLQMAEFLNLVDEEPNVGVDLLFVDGEEGWPGEEQATIGIGAKKFVTDLNNYYIEKPVEVINIDLVGEKDAQFFQEKDSLQFDKSKHEKLFQVGNELYGDMFMAMPKYQIWDDFTAFNQLGIPAQLLIDFDYKYFHTAKDSLNKIDSMSLANTGNVLLRYLYTEYGNH